MGNKILDQYSLLHFSVGVIAYFFNIGLLPWAVIHTLFEIIENSPTGMSFINNNLSFWPGGKPRADAVINQVGDTISAILGWLVAYLIDQLGKKYNWY